MWQGDNVEEWGGYSTSGHDEYVSKFMPCAPSGSFLIPEESFVMSASTVNLILSGSYVYKSLRESLLLDNKG